MPLRPGIAAQSPTEYLRLINGFPGVSSTSASAFVYKNRPGSVRTLLAGLAGGPRPIVAGRQAAWERCGGDFFPIFTLPLALVVFLLRALGCLPPPPLF